MKLNNLYSNKVQQGKGSLPLTSVAIEVVIESPFATDFT